MKRTTKYVARYVHQATTVASVLEDSGSVMAHGRDPQGAHPDVPQSGGGRDLRVAPPGVIMALCGWDTRSMFDRYDIINEEDLAVAMAKRYGTVAAQSEAPAANAA